MVSNGLKNDVTSYVRNICEGPKCRASQQGLDFYLDSSCEKMSFSKSLGQHVTAEWHREATAETRLVRNYEEIKTTAQVNHEVVEEKNYGSDPNVTQDSGIDEITATSSTKTANLEVVDLLTKTANDEAADWSTKTCNQRYLDLLDPERDIYDLGDRAREIQSGIGLCLVNDSGAIYCLACHKIVAATLENYTDHPCSPDVYEYLDEISRNGAESEHLNGRFDDFAGRFGDFALAEHYMQRVSETVANCLVCHLQIRNGNCAFVNHAKTLEHRENRREMHARVRRNFAATASRLSRCSWHRVHHYSCLPCVGRFDNETSFALHARSAEHASRARNERRSLVHEFCEICALLWCGYRGSYAAHRESRLHNWHIRNGRYATVELPERTRRFLRGSLDDAAIDDVAAVSAREERKNEAPVRDLGNRVAMIFPYALIRAFGTIISSHCTINVFLGCEKMNDGRTLAENQIFFFMASVHNWLTEDPRTWDVKALITGGRSPVIRAGHKPSGISCDISFDNGLLIGGTTYVELFDEIFPASGKLIHYLTQWLAHCELTGSHHMSSYVLYWCVIFYLQKASVLPSVAALMAHAGAHTINGYQVDRNNCSLKELVIGFFKFYANFDFRYDVACPLIGDVVKKRSFAYPEDLPVEMAFYVAYVKNAREPEEFSIEAPMCIQDPFSLNRNVSEAVSKVDLISFRTCCTKTAEYLCSF